MLVVEVYAKPGEPEVRPIWTNAVDRMAPEIRKLEILHFIVRVTADRAEWQSASSVAPQRAFSAVKSNRSSQTVNTVFRARS